MARPTKFKDKWRIRWMDETGSRKSRVFFTFDEADLALKTAEAEVAKIRAGLRMARPLERKFDELCDYWVSSRAPLKRSGKNDESIIRAHLRDFFGTQRIRDLGQRQVDAYRASRRHLSDKTVNNHLTLFISMLNAGLDMGWLHKVPRLRKPKVHLANQDYRYLKSSQEIERFLASAKEEGETVHALYAVAIGTGMRFGELAGLKWSRVDFERRLIAVEVSYDGPTKNGEVRYVPIFNDLLTVLRAWRLMQPGVLVFANRSGCMFGKSARISQEVLHRVLTRAGFDKVKRDGKWRNYIRFHDLRHTFASHWMTSGGDLFKLQKILGHKTVQMTLRYAHLQPNAYQEDYHRFACLKPSKSGVVVDFPLPEGSVGIASGDHS